MSPDFERSGQYVATPASRHDLTQELRMRIHEEAVEACKDGKKSSENPYSHGCAAYLQWEHSFDEWKEATDDDYYEP